MIPDNYYKALHVGGVGNDKQFIIDQLAQITYKQRETACFEYSRIYEESGRTEANTRLRRFVSRCIGINSGQTISLDSVENDH